MDRRTTVSISRVSVLTRDKKHCIHMCSGVKIVNRDFSRHRVRYVYTINFTKR